MNELLFLVEEDIHGGYNARGLNEPIFTQGDTLDELKINIKDAISCHYDDISLVPQIIRLHFIREEILTYA